MTQIEAMLEDGIVPDFEELYQTGELVPVRQRPAVLNPITPEVPGFEHLTPEEITEILEIEGF